MKININDVVRVRLTEHGRALHREDYKKLWERIGQKAPEYKPPKEDAGGWSEWRLWVLMKDFGPYMDLGSRIPFETDIELPNGDKLSRVVV